MCERTTQESEDKSSSLDTSGAVHTILRNSCIQRSKEYYTIYSHLMQMTTLMQLSLSALYTTMTVNNISESVITNITP